MRVPAAIAAVVLLLLAAGCGGSESSDETTTRGAATPAKEAESRPLYEMGMGPAGKEWLRAAEATGKGGDPRWAELKKAARPEAAQLVFPQGAPPEEVVFKDLRIGKGTALKPGDHFGVDYTSFDYKSGRQEQESSNGAAPLYAYGEDELVDAWEPGLKGMRAGGVREIVAPGSWVYGSPTVYLLKLVTVEKQQ